jgi:hypothetical protein
MQDGITQRFQPSQRGVFNNGFGKGTRLDVFYSFRTEMANRPSLNWMHAEGPRLRRHIP